LEQVSFLQLRTAENTPTKRALEVLRRRAFALKSKSLALLSTRLDAVMENREGIIQDPFTKVKDLISDMIQRLEKDAAAEALHKSYCDKELQETEEKQQKQNAKLDKMTTKIQQMTAQGAFLNEQVVALSNEIAVLNEEQAQMAKIRQEENTVYNEERPIAAQGLEGVKMALKVLRDYYGQQDAEHDAAEGSATGIIGILEVAESDFSRNLVDMDETEAKAKHAYTVEVKANDILLAKKTADRDYKTKEAASLLKSAAQLTADKRGVKEQSAAVDDYMKGLQKECVREPQSYEAQKERREQEIDGLKEALDVLSDDSLIQTSSKHTLRGKHVSLSA